MCNLFTQYTCSPLTHSYTVKEARNFDELKLMIDEYIEYYNTGRKQLNLKKMTPEALPKSSNRCIIKYIFFYLTVYFIGFSSLKKMIPFIQENV
ncbi:IS3 family transposase [Metabacillus halosaccharovorans]|uniref:IS3 family transposase n=1 Tax=Metabacillus halosaccharovorans TaxID=930124 RepID=UPI00384DC9E8